MPSISANGTANGILWTIDPAGALNAYDASDLGTQLYQGNAGSYVKFSTPTVANGKVYVPRLDSLVVFGLEQPAGSVAAVVNADGFQPGPVAPGSLVALFGSNLVSRVAQASSSQWPKVLGDTSVFINGVAAPVGYVSPTQINARVPFETAPGQASVTVIADGRVLAPVELAIGRAIPAHAGVH